MNTYFDRMKQYREWDRLNKLIIKRITKRDWLKAIIKAKKMLPLIVIIMVLHCYFMVIDGWLTIKRIDAARIHWISIAPVSFDSLPAIEKAKIEIISNQYVRDGGI